MFSSNHVAICYIEKLSDNIYDICESNYQDIMKVGVAINFLCSDSAEIKDILEAKTNKNLKQIMGQFTKSSDDLCELENDIVLYFATIDKQRVALNLNKRFNSLRRMRFGSDFKNSLRDVELPEQLEIIINYIDRSEKENKNISKNIEKLWRNAENDNNATKLVRKLEEIRKNSVTKLKNVLKNIQEEKILQEDSLNKQK